MTTAPPNLAHLTLITGPSGAGKTRLCLWAAARARALGRRVAGLASPPVFAASIKAGIDLLALDSGERRRLAARRPAGRSGELCTADWELDPAVLAWGEAVLDRANARPGDWLVIDELGVLEFERGGGLRAGLRLVDQAPCCCHLLVVVRPALLGAALRRWPWARVHSLGSSPAGGLWPTGGPP